MKQTNINIDEIKRFSTVTNPIKADDLHTPQAYAYTLRRAIVTDCNDRQRAELVKLLEGKDTAEGVTFNNTKANRDRLHIWQNSESRKQRAAILGDGWQWVEGINHGTQPGDVITCTDGTRGRVTKADPESCVIEFETENGQRLSVAGYFRYTPSEKSETAHDEEDPTLTEAEKRDTLCRLWDAAWQQARQDPEGTRVIVETNEEDPTAPANEFGRYYMVDGSESESCIEHAGQWVVIRVDTVTSPYEVHRPNYAAAHGYSDNQTQLACRCENPNNVTRWARKMIDAGRVTDIYADCY
jgi:hypothetical protein